MKKRTHFIFGIVRLFSDLVAITYAFLFAYWVRFTSGLVPVLYGIPDLKDYIETLPIITVLLIFIMRSFGLYATRRRLSILDEFFAIVKSMAVGLFALMAATFFTREFTYSRIMLPIMWISLVLFISVARFIVNRLRLVLRSSNRDYSNLLIIGSGSTSQRLIRHIRHDPHWNYKISGVVSVSKESINKEIDGVKVIGGLDELPLLLSRRDVEEVILTEPSLSRNKIMSIILECEKRMIHFRLIADILGMITAQVDMENIDGIPLLGLKESPLSFGYNRFLKRAIDIIGSSIGLFLLFPLFIIIGVIIKISSPGPIFYLQKRLGEDGRRFAIFKFRTMIHKAEKGVGAVWAKKDDPRRTKIGSFLRASNLDELPQLINVFKGEMSLVGPRPERPKFVGKFKEDIPRYMSRHKIRSGVTGWAQVNGLRGNTSIEERTKYDIYYVENWSLFFDVKILIISVFQTLFSRSEHAY
ncbi:undecaprenyl-phosphate glucose phosphotransferase [Candidatus Omnitrophota bacterium]